MMHNIFWIICFAFAFSISSCSKEDDAKDNLNLNEESDSSQRGVLELSHSSIKLSKNKGKAYFMINSNTSWNIFVNNTGQEQSINDLNVYPLNGNGNTTITIEYGGVDTEYYQQQASISVYYMSYGTKQVETVGIFRRNLPW